MQRTAVNSFNFWSRLLLLQRDAICKRGLCCRPLSVFPSVCLSVCHVGGLYPHAKDIVKLLARPGSPIILLCWLQALIPNSKGNPSSGAQNTRGSGKNLRFPIEIAVYLGNGMRKAHGCYGTLIGSHRRRIDPCQFRRPWETPNPGFKVTVYLQVEYIKKVRHRDRVTMEH